MFIIPFRLALLETWMEEYAYWNYWGEGKEVIWTCFSHQLLVNEQMTAKSLSDEQFLHEQTPLCWLLQVPVVFKQHGVVEPRLSTDVKPMTSLDYAWDEPILPPFITLTVKGAGSSEVMCCMNDFQDSKLLYYENFIYIAATYTFSG